jgi:hypothetical protein
MKHEAGTARQQVANPGSLIYSFQFSSVQYNRSHYEHPTSAHAYNKILLVPFLEDAFAEAKSRFSSILGKDQWKVAFVNSKSSVEEVRTIVAKSMEKYESQKALSKSKKWLRSFSQKVEIYGDVLDVLVQHHPQYVALVWGAMKFLFTVCMIVHLESSLDKLIVDD